MLNSPL